MILLFDMSFDNLANNYFVPTVLILLSALVLCAFLLFKWKTKSKLIPLLYLTLLALLCVLLSFISSWAERNNYFPSKHITVQQAISL